MTIDWKQLWRALKRLGRWLNKFPAWLQQKDKTLSTFWVRVIFFFNIPFIISLPLRVFVARLHASTLDLVYWFFICLYTYHWYFSCNFPWQKEDNNDNRGSTGSG